MLAEHDMNNPESSPAQIRAIANNSQESIQIHEPRERAKTYQEYQQL